MRNKNLRLSGMMLAGVILIVSFVGAINIQPAAIGDSGFFKTDSSVIKNFNSYRELTDFLNNKPDYYTRPWESMRGIGPQLMAVEDSEISIFSNANVKSGGTVVDYSQTNVQVTGVDEPDIVKTDGEYLYIVTGNKVIIVKATPAEDAKIEGEVSVDDSLTIRNIFISGNRLVIFAEDYSYPIYYDSPNILEKEFFIDMVAPKWYDSPDTHIQVFDLEDIEDTKLVKDVVTPGSLSGARMIGDFVYVITTQYPNDVVPLEDHQVILPKIMVDGKEKIIGLSDISYVDTPEQSSIITNIVSVNVQDESEDVSSKIYLLGSSNVIYVSKDNIYITYTLRTYDYDLLEEIVNEVLESVLTDSAREELELVKTLSLNEYQKKTVAEWIIQHYTESMTDNQKLELAREINRRIERTIIHRISIDNGEITYQDQGEMPGSVNNQFSLSEFDGHLRVSSTMDGRTISGSFPRLETQNNIYILDMELNIVGKLEGLAPGERIYATRFIGDKCYLVTFRQIDPFFVIDLSNPNNPEVLGELKIPGYSTYLHPYDATHIIGVGMEDRNVKISLFDVSDLSNLQNTK
jgi:uncharacterized secreted protein with C-terminal beta-propeller domain